MQFEVVTDVDNGHDVALVDLVAQGTEKAGGTHATTQNSYHAPDLRGGVGSIPKYDDDLTAGWLALGFGSFTPRAARRSPRDGGH